MDDLLAAAILALRIDVPIYRTRVVGERIELHLYGGRVLTFSPEPVPPPDPGVPPSSAGVEAASSSAPARGKKGKATKCPS